MSDLYMKGFQSGAQAVIDYIAEQWPHLAEGDDEYPCVTTQVAEHIHEMSATLRAFLGSAP